MVCLFELNVVTGSVLIPSLLIYRVLLGIRPLAIISTFNPVLPFKRSEQEREFKYAFECWEIRHEKGNIWKIKMGTFRSCGHVGTTNLISSSSSTHSSPTCPNLFALSSFYPSTAYLFVHSHSISPPIAHWFSGPIVQFPLLHLPRHLSL